MFIAKCKTLLLSMTNIALDKEKIDDSHLKKNREVYSDSIYFSGFKMTLIF